MADDKRKIAQLDRLSLCPLTPPETLPPDSPTPSVSLPVSSVDKIIAELRNRCRGRPQVEEEWWCVSLSLDEFNALEARIEADEDLHGSKYDYFPDLAKFVLRMAGDLRESVIRRFEKHINFQLLSIQQDGSLVNGERILRIGLKDFGNRHDCPGIDEVSGEITISFSQLYNIVQRSEVAAQGMEQRRKQKQGQGDVGYIRPIKRKMAQSPPKELNVSDEERLKAVEEEVDKRLHDQDSEYVL
ncbi:hypothetical protein QBC46DRAFT_350719 [Diplogelasinospora grovesii]|uniref:Uncharacterized protein n=1 Tax=Diplogelasinospora grovesii TaxID=303347 RepID=A0AAN6NIH8_9PEZI|nr:hypothetical protein QBC46DRAFT_350719 [Diplogelasinospora grovesii]